MKIYNEVVIDMNPESSGYGDTLYETSFQDDGPIAECLFGMGTNDYTYTIYDSAGNEYTVKYAGSEIGKDYEGVYIYNSDGTEIFKNTGKLGDYTMSEAKDQVDSFFAGSKPNKAYADDPIDLTITGGDEGGMYSSGSEAYEAMHGSITKIGDDPTFDELYAAQGLDMSSDWQGSDIDPLQVYAMEEFGINADQYATMTPLSMEPMEALNVKYQEDVDVFSQQLRDTNVSLTTEIGSVQSMGGFAGESGAITQPLEQQKTLAELGGLTQYGALSSGRFSDIKEEKRTQYDLFYEQGYSFDS